MTIALAGLAGVLAGRLLWVALRDAFTAPVFARPNYRGEVIPTAAGIVVPLAVILGESARLVAGAAGVGEGAGLSPGRAGVVVAAVGFSLLGLVDDLVDVPDSPRGFRGHIGAAAHGRLTTGGLKLLGGGAVAIVAVAIAGDADPSLWRLVADALLVALAANLANLLDRAPGRAIKATALGAVVLVAATVAPTQLVGLALAVGAGLALAVDDLRERLMLGDAGANPLGAVVGLGVVVATSSLTRDVVLLGLVAFNLLSEWVSFSRVIEAVPPLRAADRAGRLPHDHP